MDLSAREQRAPRPRHERLALVSRVLMVLSLCSLVVALRIAGHHFDASRLVVAGDRFFDERKLTYPIAVERNSEGYDGQFYYRLALDPFTTTRTEYGITMEEHPQVRAQRIAFPAAAWALSLGRGSLVPWTMLVLNLASLAGLCWIGGAIARLHDMPARLGLLFSAYPGFLISLTRDTVEAPACFLALLAHYLFASGRARLGAPVACLAVLTRETTLLYAAGFGLMALWGQMKGRSEWRRIVLCLAPVATLVVWNLELRHVWGSFPFQDLGSHDVGPVPLQGFLDWATVYAFRLAQRTDAVRNAFCLIAMLMVPVFVAIVARRSELNEATAPSLIPWGLYTLLACLFTGAIWNEAYGFLRILCDAYVLGLVCLIASRRLQVLDRLGWVAGGMWIATVGYVA